MNLFIAIIIILLSCFFIWRKTRTTFCHHWTDLRGQVAVVTGANVGIGKETARELAKRGARVILACRSMKRGEAAADDIRRTVNDAEVTVRQLDLSSLKDVKKFADGIIREERYVDMLINNAAVATPLKPVTLDGFETTFATNHLGPFLLTLLLMDLLKKSRAKRIVTVASFLNVGGCVNFDENGEIETQGGIRQQYVNSKLMNYFFVSELHRRFHYKGINVFSVNPGVVNTAICRNVFHNEPLIIFKPLVYLFQWINKTTLEGCQTVIYCAVAPNIERYSGEHFKECHVQHLSDKVRNEKLAERLWQYSEAKVKAFL